MASLFYITEKYNTKNRCIKHLEKVRWNNKPVCPHCAEKQRITKRIARKFFYHCNNCNKDFTVLYGTIFEDSKLGLPKWFVLIGLMLNSRKGISAMAISRHLNVTYKTAWYSAMRVRCCMIDNGEKLEGIVEMDEAYLGGRPRKGNTGKNPPDNEAYLGNVSVVKRGRGTKKVPIIGIVERNGKKRVVAQVGNRLNSAAMLAMLKKFVKQDNAIVMTDEARFYNKFDDIVQHLVIKHKEKFADGIINTNRIENFWSIIKNGIRGEYHVLSKKYLPFYLAEFSYKYNSRFTQQKAFEDTIKNAVTDESCLVNYKPKKSCGTPKKCCKKSKQTSKEAAAVLKDVQRIIDAARRKKKRRLVK